MVSLPFNKTAMQRVLLVLALAPLCAGWDGAASGTVSIKDAGALTEGTAVLEGGVSVGGTVHAVFNLHQPGGLGGVLSMEVSSAYLDSGLDLPHDGARLRYVVYDDAGNEVFASRLARRGQLVLERTVQGLYVLLNAEMVGGASGERSVSLVNLQARVVEVSAPPPPREYYADPYDNGPDVYVEVHAGHSSGCDADDWEDDGWADDSADYDSGGCAGDDIDSGSSYDSGGCDGDGLEGAGDAASSCEGDAIASTSGGRRKSSTLLRLINFSPWLLCFLAIRVMRRRRL